ncbi:MAG: DEAD/DEAH box helicase [Polyangiales bacterium]
MRFSELAIPTLLRDALTARGYLEATPVQSDVLDAGLLGRDLLVSSRTGSGKTVAFGLVLSPLLLSAPDDRAGPATKPRALVMTPTRELAMQVERELQWLFAGTGLRTVACVGGMAFGPQARALEHGAHLVVGTPGRLCDHLDRGTLKLDGLSAVVLDEADEMLDMGFREELERVLDATPAERRTLMFSATLPSEVTRLAARYQKSPARVAATPVAEAHADIAWIAHVIAGRARARAVVNVLRHYEAPAALVFCQTRDGVAHLTASLRERGFRCEALHGDLTQPERSRALQALRDGSAKVLVATDVAARGLDVPALDLVVHADLPNDPSALQHRSGRTGRAGRKGTSVLLVPAERRRVAASLLRAVKVVAEWEPVPSAEAIASTDRDRLASAARETTAEVTDEDRAIARALLEGGDATELVSGLVARLRRELPEPEDLPLTRAIPSFQSFEQRAPVEFAPRRPGEDVGSAWYRVNLGRRDRAEARWLLPMLCRVGGVTSADIGAIRVLDSESLIEVLQGAAGAFAENMERSIRKEKGLRMERLRAAPDPREFEGSRPRRPAPRPNRRHG